MYSLTVRLSVLCMEPLADKWKVFGWNVIEVDGHSVRELLEIVDMVTKGVESCQMSPGQL